MSTLPSAPPSAASRFGVLMLAAVLAGLLVAGVMLPAMGTVGLVAKESAISFDALPTDLKTPPLAERTTIEASDGTYITSFYSKNRKSVSLNQIPDSMQKAIVSIEDSRFYEHNGVDPKGIVRAFVADQRTGTYSQGASTLTQQYVKQVLLLQADNSAQVSAAAGKNRARKVREIRYALALEQKLSKDQILERYLNIAYFGESAYGIDAAARVYFDKPVDALTLPESAMLAGLVQQPSGYDPFHNQGKPAKTRRNTVLARMSQLGYITTSTAKKAEATSLGLKRGSVANGCTQANVSKYFCDYVYRYLLNDPVLGSTAAARKKMLEDGGLTVRTSIDPKMQQIANAAAKGATPFESTFATGITAVEPGTGQVKAMAINRDFLRHQTPYLSGRLDGKVNGYQFGSTFKMFTMIAALEQGIPLDKNYYSPYHYTSPVCFNGNSQTHYSLVNDNTSMVGNFDMLTGFGASINTYFVQLEQQIGPDKAAKVAQQMGLANPRLASQVEKRPYDHCSFTLGSYGATPLEMANAYATLAARGLYCPATPILSITDHNGKPIALNNQKCTQVMKPEIADAATKAATWVVHPPHGFTSGPTGTQAYLGRPVAGKTGTAQNDWASTFVGFTPQLAASVYIGNPDELKSIPRKYLGNNDSAFGAFMKKALAGQPVKNFVQPPDSLRYSPGANPNSINPNGIGTTQPTLQPGGLTDRGRTGPPVGVAERFRAGVVQTQQTPGIAPDRRPSPGGVLGGPAADTNRAHGTSRSRSPQRRLP